MQFEHRFVVGQFLGAGLLFGLLSCQGCAPAPCIEQQTARDNDAFLDELKRDARSNDEDVRFQARGTLLDRLKLGMTRTEVEAWLGPPDAELPQGWEGEKQVAPVSYAARFPDYEGAWLNSLYYDINQNPPKLVRMHGPYRFNCDAEDPPDRFDPNELRVQGSSASMEELVREASSKVPIVRQKAVGALLLRLKPGMTRQEVEAWLGPPDEDMPELGSSQERADVCYKARYPKLQGTQFIGVAYDVKVKPYKFMTYYGPISPEELKREFPTLSK